MKGMGTPEAHSEGFGDWRDVLGFCLVAVVSLLSGVAAVAVETARLGADYYDGGNNFANGVAIIFFPMIAVPIACVVFMLLKAWRRPWWVATGCALIPALCLVAFWNLHTGA